VSNDGGAGQHLDHDRIQIGFARRRSRYRRYRSLLPDRLSGDVDERAIRTFQFAEDAEVVRAANAADSGNRSGTPAA
jgi:hypothetical protein